MYPFPFTICFTSGTPMGSKLLGTLKDYRRGVEELCERGVAKLLT